MDIRESKTFEDITLIAPCGINCGLFRAYLKAKKPCPGSRGGNNNISASCLKCNIKNCGILRQDRLQYCFNCSKYPCETITHLDLRYRTKYQVSPIENLTVIKTEGIQELLNREKRPWICKKCGNTICMHKGHCIQCGAVFSVE